MQAEIYNIDYTQVVHVLGTTHFSKRSLLDAYREVERLKPTDLAVELDMKRYRILHSECSNCPQSNNCNRKCEFIGAVESIGNKDTNIWLIDMSKSQFTQRLYRSQHRYSHWRVLLNERDTLMAARLAWIVTESLKKNEKPHVLALVGAAHRKGIQALLSRPTSINENLKWLDLSFTPPTLIRRIAVVGD